MRITISETCLVGELKSDLADLQLRYTREEIEALLRAAGSDRMGLLRHLEPEGEWVKVEGHVWTLWGAGLYSEADRVLEKLQADVGESVPNPLPYADLLILLRRIARRYDPDDPLQGEVLREIARRVPRLLETYDPRRGPLRPYLIRALAAAAYEHARCHRDGPTPSRSDRVSMPQLLEALPSPEREALRAWYLEGKSKEEIADLLNLDTEAAREAIQRGIDAARKRIARDD